MYDMFNNHDWNHFHDIVLSVTKLRCTRKKLEEIFEKLPENIKEDANHWGLTDSVIRDKIYVWLESNLESIK